MALTGWQGGQSDCWCASVCAPPSGVYPPLSTRSEILPRVQAPLGGSIFERALVCNRARAWFGHRERRVAPTVPMDDQTEPLSGGVEIHHDFFDEGTRDPLPQRHRTRGIAPQPREVLAKRADGHSSAGLSVAVVSLRSCSSRASRCCCSSLALQKHLGDQAIVRRRARLRSVLAASAARARRADRCRQCAAVRAQRYSPRARAVR